ncbi:MAG: Asparaginase [Chthonomonadales bacterium]|nr:Asparaginase [Chthonomonadales bacterium]
MSIAIIVHGGASTVPPEKQGPKRAGCVKAVRVGWAILSQGGSALDAVEGAIRILEDDPNFNAGFGSMLQPDGMVRMDAGLMEGRDLQAGAVAAIEGVRHPISVARQVLIQPPVLIVGPYARDFARRSEAEMCSPTELISEEQYRHWEAQQAQQRPAGRSHDTVGCVALDQEGNLACGASTGGLGDTVPGRVGDSASIGAGFYADNSVGACALTGDGETIMRLAQARMAMELLHDGLSAEEAVQRSMEILGARVDGEGGCILIDRAGSIGWGHNSPQMPCAYFRSGMDAPVAFIAKQEERAERSFQEDGK